MGQNSIISSFFAEGRSPPQGLEEGPRSGPYLLVIVKMIRVTAITTTKCMTFFVFFLPRSVSQAERRRRGRTKMSIVSGKTDITDINV